MRPQRLQIMKIVCDLGLSSRELHGILTAIGADGLSLEKVQRLVLTHITGSGDDDREAGDMGCEDFLQLMVRIPMRVIAVERVRHQPLYGCGYVYR